MFNVVTSVLSLLILVVYGVFRYVVRPEKQTMRGITIAAVIGVVLVGGLRILLLVAARYSDAADEASLSQDVSIAMSGLTGWPVWVVTLLAIVFVVWRGLLPAAIGLTSVKRVHPTRAALGVIGAIIGLGFLVTYTIARILERHARLRHQEIMGDI